MTRAAERPLVVPFQNKPVKIRKSSFPIYEQKTQKPDTVVEKLVSNIPAAKVKENLHLTPTRKREVNVDILV